MPYLIEDFSPAVTYEGDNTVMAQQSCRFLQKLYKKAKQGKPMPSDLYDYIAKIDKNLQLKCLAKSPYDFTSLEQVDESLKVIAAASIDKTMRKVLSSSEKMKVIVNKTMALDLVNLTKKHINYMTFICFKKSIMKLKD